ncbi:rhodanese-like domain-containing protein [Lactobacillus acidophilus]|uniref:rhodanese-like domain-containing protein n=1 Tax=Lactobacillus acidophilus TaxID=1579 RepID=UPI003F52CC42
MTLLIDISEENIPELKQLQKDLKKHNSNLISLSIPELRNKIKKEDIYIIDLRSKDEFDTGHLPGAHNIPFNKIDDEMNKLPRDREMVIYCRGRLCPYSDIVGNKLKMAGYNVQTFNNTVWEWQQAVEG